MSLKIAYSELTEGKNFSEYEKTVINLLSQINGNINALGHHIIAQFPNDSMSELSKAAIE